MKVIDFTQFISEDMPVYPGTEGPKLQPANTYEKDGFKETLMTMYSHTGTHMDPPAHLFAHRPTLDKLPIEQFVGAGLVIDCTDLGEGGVVDFSYIEKVRDKADKAEFLLFRFGWDKYWGKQEYFGEYPVINDDVSSYLIDTKKKGVGLDAIGIDPISDSNLTTHRKLFINNDIVVIENLTRLGEAGQDLFTFIALPLKHVDADGSPIRAIGLL